MLPSEVECSGCKNTVGISLVVGVCVGVLSQARRLCGWSRARAKWWETRSTRQKGSLLSLAGPEWDYGSDSE